MPPKTVQIDSSRWPLVTVRFVGDLLEDEFDAYLRFLNANMERTERESQMTAIVFDSRQVGRVLPSIRAKMTRWIQSNTAQTRRTCAGFGFVIDSQLVRGLLTAVLWVVPIPAPHAVTSTVTEAEDFLTNELEKHGVRITAPRFSVPPVSIKSSRPRA